MFPKKLFLMMLFGSLLTSVAQAQRNNEWIKINLQSGEEETVYVDEDCDEMCELPALPPTQEEEDELAGDVWLDADSFYEDGGFQTLELSLEGPAFPDQNLTPVTIVGRDSRINITRRAKGISKAAVTLEVMFDNNNWGWCSGAMVGPNLVLTAAHCLYDKGRTAQDIAVVASGLKKQPVAYAVDVWFPPEFIKTQAHDYDMGLILLDRHLGKQTGILGLKTIREGTYQDFPTLVIGRGGDKPMRSLWKSYGYIGWVYGSYIFTSAPIVGGNSGGPLIVQGGKIAGILTSGIPAITWKEFLSNPVKTVFIGILKLLDRTAFYPNIALHIDPYIIKTIKYVNKDIAKQEQQLNQKQKAKQKKTSKRHKRTYRA